MYRFFPVVEARAKVPLQISSLFILFESDVIIMHFDHVYDSPIDCMD